MVITNVPIKKIRKYAKNAKKHPVQQVEYIANSIKEFGFRQFLVLSSDFEIVVGHGRYLAAKQLGLNEVPCLMANDLTDEQIKAYRLADNKTNESEWNKDFLKLELDELGELFDMSSFGFDVETDVETDVDGLSENSIDAKLGDIWKLGAHTLMCGDSTSKEDVLLLMGDAKADMVFTDPPYGVNVKGGKKKNHIAGDLTQVAIPFAFEWAVSLATKDSARLYFCGGEGNLGLYEKLFDRYLHQLPKHIVWVKENFVIKPNGYHNKYELIYYGYKPGGGGTEHWYAGRTESEASDVWQISRDAAVNYLHPTQKPIEIPSRAIKNSSAKGMTVYEPFCGSGSTLIACEQLERSCYAMEIDPHYCGVIIRRWEQLVGEKAKLLT